MDDHLFGMVELILIFGIVLGWACWDLLSLSRGSEQSAADGSAESPSPQDPGDANPPPRDPPL